MVMSWKIFRIQTLKGRIGTTLLHFSGLERLILRNQDFNHYQTSEKSSTENSP